MQLTDDQIKKILVSESYITAADVARADEYTRQHHTTFRDFLRKEKIITQDLLGQAIAESSGVPYCDLNSAPPTAEAVKKIPEDIAKKTRAVLFRDDEDTVTITTDEPKSAELLPEMEKLFQGKKIIIMSSLSEDIDASFVHYQKPLDTRYRFDTVRAPPQGREPGS